MQMINFIFHQSNVSFLLIFNIEPGDMSMFQIHEVPFITYNYLISLVAVLFSVLSL
jgi:hypothetical protein